MARLGRLALFALLVIPLSACAGSESNSQTTTQSASVASSTTTTDPPAIGTTSTSSTTTTTTVPPAVDEAYAALRQWELSVLGGLERGEISRTWPPVYAAVVAPLEVLEPSERRDSLLAAAEAWTRCANRVNDSLTHVTYDDSITARLGLLQQEIALTLEENLSCHAAVRHMDEARLALGLDALYGEDSSVRFAEVVGDLKLTLKTGGFGSALDVDEEFASIPLGHHFERTVGLLTLIFGPPDFDSGWEEPFLRAECPGNAARWVDWGGLTIVGVAGDPPDNKGWYPPEYFFSYSYRGGDPHLATPEGVGVGDDLAQWRLAYEGRESPWGEPMDLEIRDGGVWRVLSKEWYGPETHYIGHFNPDSERVETVLPGDYCGAIPEGD